MSGLATREFWLSGCTILQPGIRLENRRDEGNAYSDSETARKVCDVHVLRPISISLATCAGVCESCAALIALTCGAEGEPR